MSAGWTAASVRAGGLARQRLGAGRCRDLAAQHSLAAAVTLLRATVYARFLAPGASLEDAAHGTRAAVLWELRVLAGWLPPSGARLARALAAGFERDNIAGHAARLSGRPAPPAFELGTLATAWPRLRQAGSTVELETELAHTVWASAPRGLPLRDRLTLAWLRRLDAVAPAVRPWHELAVVTLMAKTWLFEGTAPPPAFREEAARLVGSRWETAHSIDELREALPPAPRRILAEVTASDELWRAEAALWHRIEDDAFAWVRSPREGPETILGSIALLASDARRVRAALASAAAGGLVEEVFDVVA
ncbi:hypothetical protein SPF06_19045 [Sinomonas sp. JGH33]|uniref:V-type ATPase subunit n=1 Tax=Sinomonas terricola TaxID=3110330 RepID=A0ABU5TBG1_9MICC|nr:hypothetical protein [Sinomonas sp. JGH33]MEA5456824.1 hypothetical protein [Sinomonas sp. JGH33]